MLAQVPGLNRRFVYYLEAKGIIQPAKVRKERIARRDYSQQDVQAIQEVWKYYQRGYSLQIAHDLATRTHRMAAYVAVPAPIRTQSQVLERLREYPQVTEASVVYGVESRILLKTETPDEMDLFHTLVPFLAEIGMTGLPEVLRAKETFQRTNDKRGKKSQSIMLAYVLMKVPGKEVDAVMEELKVCQEVVEASTVYGESDIVAKVQVKDQKELDSLVMGRIHGIPAVESTRTFIVVERLHWER